MKIKQITRHPYIYFSLSLCQNAIPPEAVGSQTIKDRGFIPLKKTDIGKKIMINIKKEMASFDFNGLIRLLPTSKFFNFGQF
ncbi:hypothetical protein [Heyndrickxia coagulans]|uniref:hypothetical protein n=1 Tax=Heyndrickxia coagulans TaxID=1398 RepID=UPI0012FE0872|nr:hypothetical protein [Heyndrickxia coagulans]